MRISHGFGIRFLMVKHTKNLKNLICMRKRAVMRKRAKRAMKAIKCNQVP